MKNWHRVDHESYTLLTLDAKGKSANVLSREVLAEFDELLTDLTAKPPPGLIIRSGKKSGFIFGADINEFINITDAKKGADVARYGQGIFSKLEKLPCKTVAIIQGNCLGGGTELILACDYRVACNDDSTRIGLPEVRLGINPGFGGTVRLPRLVGDLAALDMMLTGRALRAKAARRIGLVNDLVPERHLLTAAEAWVKRKKKFSLSFLKTLPGWAPLRPLVASMMTRQVKKKARPEHYPAPFRIIKLWLTAANYEAEAVSLGEMMVTDASRNLVRVFQLSEALKHQGKTHEHHVEHVHVIGAGVMGGDIAAWAALKGFRVSLQDQREEAIAKAIKRAHGLFRKKLKDKRKIEEAMDRLLPDLSGEAVRHADLVIEAIVENEAAKQGLFKDVESKVDPKTILATNTSSIPLEVISQSLKDPSRLVGLHFFNPVAMMQLVEIVRGEQTSDEMLNRARAFTTAIGRLPLDVKSSPGFLVNRILMPYLIEAMQLAGEGVSLAEIDNQALKFGMPMGPIQLADTVGLDICLFVAQELSGPLGIAVPDALAKMVEAGNLGRKSGKGFYSYDKKGHVKKPAARGTNIPVADRLIMRILNEASACLREGVVTGTDDVDAGMVYGTGFAPFRGGPMHYAEKLGHEAISHTLYRLSEEFGERFKPDTGWS